MRLLTAIFLLFAPFWLRAQAPVQLSPGAAAQIMVPQPVVDISQIGNVSATAAFTPPVVGAGESTFYRVTVAATENSVAWPDKMDLPAGLNVRSSVHGQISRMEGNQFRPLTSFVYEVTPAMAVHFVVSNFVVQVAGKPVEIPAAILDVTEGVSTPAPVRRLWLEISPTNLFFGQPFRVRVLLPAGQGNQIDALREVGFNGVGFMTDRMATRQSVETVTLGGQAKPAYIYETVATPLTAGPVTISAQGFATGRDFGGPITISGPGQIVIAGGPPQYALLSSDAVRLNVRALPVEGELPGFTGTLGKFLASPPQLSTNRLRVGQPVHLKYSLQPGTNLTHYVPPETPRVRDWQIIADQPSANGYTFIPLTDEVTSTPAIPFSAFDPATKSYYDLTIPALPVTVTSEGLPVQLPAWSADDGNSAPLKLSGLATAPGRTVASLKPLQLHGWFVLLQLLPVIGFILLWRWDVHRRFLEAHPEIVRRRKAKRDLYREKIKMQQAISAGDAEKFVQHAAAALRIAVAPHFPADDRALVGSDVLSQLDEAGREGPAGEIVRQIFAAADARFAVTPPSRAALLALSPGMEVMLQKLEERL